MAMIKTKSSYNAVNFVLLWMFLYILIYVLPILNLKGQR